MPSRWRCGPGACPRWAAYTGSVCLSVRSSVPRSLQHGVRVTTTAVIFGGVGGVEMLLFYPAGSIMDRFGRIWVAVPCVVLLGLGLVMLPLTHGVEAVLAVSVLAAVGNGLGSGIVMTLGA